MVSAPIAPDCGRSSLTNASPYRRAIQRDPTRFQNADVFDPSRFLNSPLSAAQYMNVQDPYERDHFSYGAGR